MNGAERVIIVDTELYWPNGLALDVEGMVKRTNIVQNSLVQEPLVQKCVGNVHS